MVKTAGRVKATEAEATEQVATAEAEAAFKVEAAERANEIAAKEALDRVGMMDDNLVQAISDRDQAKLELRFSR